MRACVRLATPLAYIHSPAMEATISSTHGTWLNPDMIWSFIPVYTGHFGHTQLYKCSAPRTSPTAGIHVVSPPNSTVRDSIALTTAPPGSRYAHRGVEVCVCFCVCRLAGISGVQRVDMRYVYVCVCRLAGISGV